MSENKRTGILTETKARAARLANLDTDYIIWNSLSRVEETQNYLRLLCLASNPMTTPADLTSLKHSSKYFAIPWEAWITVRSFILLGPAAITPLNPAIRIQSQKVIKIQNYMLCTSSKFQTFGKYFR